MYERRFSGDADDSLNGLNWRGAVGWVGPHLAALDTCGRPMAASRCRWDKLLDHSRNTKPPPTSLGGWQVHHCERDLVRSRSGAVL